MIAHGEIVVNSGNENILRGVFVSWVAALLQRLYQKNNIRELI